VATASTPPSSFDQIQAVAYCLMYERTEADIIEVTWNNTAGESNDMNTNNNNCNKTKDNKIMYDSKPADKNKSYRIPIATSRITLYDPVHRHGETGKVSSYLVFVTLSRLYTLFGAMMVKDINFYFTQQVWMKICHGS